MSDAVTIALILVVTVLGSLLGLAVVRRLAPPERLARHTDVAGYLYAVIGVIYAVILAFVVIAVWEQYQNVQDAVDNEASAVLNLARMANGWPADDQASVQSSLVTYARQVVDVEWPAMAQGNFGPASDTITVNQLFHALNEANATAETKPSSYEVSLLQLDALAEARRSRLLLGQEGLPLSMQIVLIIGAVITVAFTYLFAVEDARIHAVMTTSLAILVALLLLLIYQLGRPFQGVSAIEPTAMELVLTEIDSSSGIPGMGS